MKTKTTAKYVENLRVEVIATFNKDEQEIFDIRLTEKSIKSEKSLLEWIKMHLDSDDDLVKLSLCWKHFSNDRLWQSHPTVADSIARNGIYSFVEETA